MHLLIKNKNRVYIAFSKEAGYQNFAGLRDTEIMILYKNAQKAERYCLREKFA